MNYSSGACICRSIGDPDFKPNGKRIVTSTPDVRVVELNPADSAVVLASDGVWDVVTDDQIAQITNKVPRMPFSSRVSASKGPRVLFNVNFPYRVPRMLVKIHGEGGIFQMGIKSSQRDISQHHSRILACVKIRSWCRNSVSGHALCPNWLFWMYRYVVRMQHVLPSSMLAKHTWLTLTM